MSPYQRLADALRDWYCFGGPGYARDAARAYERDLHRAPLIEAAERAAERKDCPPAVREALEGIPISAVGDLVTHRVLRELTALPEGDGIVTLSAEQRAVLIRGRGPHGGAR